MKKMMAIMAAMLMAGLAQAAAVNWSTGALYTPNPDGTFSATKIGATSGTYLATVYFFADDGGAPGAAILGLTGTTDNTSTALASAFNATTSDSFTINTTYWAYVLIESTDGIYSMTSTALSFTTPGTGNATINFSSSLPSEWTVVPEPTSMALLALGVAAVGLRRRNRK